MGQITPQGRDLLWGQLKLQRYPSVYVMNTTPLTVPTSIPVANSLNYTVSMHTHTPHLFQGTPNGSSTPPFTSNPTYATTPPVTTPFTPPNQIFIPPFNSFTYLNHVPPPFSGFIPQNPHTQTGHHNFRVNPKIEFRKFDGQDPKGWVIKAELYFEFIPVEDIKKIKLSGLHFEGKPSIWFRYYQASKGLELETVYY